MIARLAGRNGAEVGVGARGLAVGELVGNWVAVGGKGVGVGEGGGSGILYAGWREGWCSIRLAGQQG